MDSLLLDTCAVIWAGNGSDMAPGAIDAINAAYSKAGTVYASPFVAWELGVLVSRGRLGLSQPPDLWFNRFLEKGGVALAPLDTDVLIASSFLPGTPPRDPADRIQIATARSMGLTLVTRDREMLAYAQAGHVRAMEC